MPARIIVAEGVIVNVSEAVPRLGIARVGDDSIRLGEVPNFRIIPTRIVKVQPQFGFQALTGVAPVSGGGAVCLARFAKGAVAYAAVEQSLGGGAQAGGAEVVAQQPVQVVFWGRGLTLCLSPLNWFCLIIAKVLFSYGCSVRLRLRISQKNILNPFYL